MGVCVCVCVFVHWVQEHTCLSVALFTKAAMHTHTHTCTHCWDFVSISSDVTEIWSRACTGICSGHGAAQQADSTYCHIIVVYLVLVGRLLDKCTVFQFACFIYATSGQCHIFSPPQRVPLGGGTLFSVSRSIRRASRCLYESHGLLICLMLFRDRGPGSANELPFSVVFSLCFSGQGFSFP